MSRIYTPNNKIKFTNISETYKVNRQFKAKLSELYSSIITYVVDTYDGTSKYRQQVVKAINLLTYYVYDAEIPPSNWSKSNPFINMPDVDDELIMEVLGDIYLTPDSVDWDVTVVDTATDVEPVQVKSRFTPIQQSVVVPTYVETPTVKETPTSDLYIQAPEVPQFDVNKPWKQKLCGADLLTIYTTLPEIPKRQRDVSITTDVSRMSDTDLRNLYPNQFIRTRPSIMYTPQTNMDFDNILGIILPIEGYSKEQIIDNMIKYPHFYKLVREQDGKFESFYGYIEIDGELKPTLDVWDSLDISKWIPKNAEFIKEYLARKYIMDRDILGVNHKYPLFGTLDPYLTLFMPESEYCRRGFDTVTLARTCVESRISYKQSRSPVLRRMSIDE